ncbi:hypothetical protein FACS1894163_03940 [Spirochaetia bacterium]|nr:hypothetical protein FACS1894163_03940 [Spirochaetia bacterium]
MNSYIIDASVYAKPSNIDNPDVIYNYCENIRKLLNIFEKKQPRNIKCFISEKDVESVIRDKELFLIKDDIEPMKLCLAKAYETHREEKYKVIIRDAQIGLDRFLSRLGIRSHLIETDNRNDDDTLKYRILFEKWFNIAGITFVETKAPVLSDVILSITKNEILRKNMHRNLALSAYLNKYVFSQKYDGQSVVLNVEGTEEVTINTSIAQVEMDRDKKTQQKVRFVISGAPDTNITLANEKVNIINIDILNSYCIDQKTIEKDLFSSTGLDKVIKKMATGFFETIIFCSEVHQGIKDYILNAENKRAKLRNEKVKLFDKIISELPDILYEYIQVLHYLVKEIKEYSFKNMEKYCFFQKLKPNFCQDCRGLIHLHGLNCSDENDEQMKCKRAQIDREKGVGDGDSQIFTYHLKPISFKKGTVLDFLTLRIYFKLIKVDGQDKIAIGWIGMHPFLPIIEMDNNKCLSYESDICDKLMWPNFEKQIIDNQDSHNPLDLLEKI